MTSFACSTNNCAGTVAPTNQGRRWVWGVLRVWFCAGCERSYLVGES